MKRVLYCKACGSPLTPVLTIVNEKTPGVSPPGEIAERYPMPPGMAFEWPQAFRRFPEVWINLGDMPGEPLYTPHKKRLNGCCGLDGCDGPNRVCRCGEHIGTEQSDCWSPRVFVPDAETTAWKDEGE
jgi:hypothetical protein